MLKIVCRDSVVNCKRYFREDFVLDDGAMTMALSRWCGRTAEMLKLSGPVTERKFNALCDNVHPQTGDRLTQRLKSNRRVGYDLCFSPPKSVSLMMYLGGDERIAVSLRASVTAAMCAMEQRALTRVRRAGQMQDRLTGNLVWAEFEHHTSRPVGGDPDPQGHIHAVVFNVTHDGEEKRYKALQFGQIYKDAPYYESIFRSTLARELRVLGYSLTEPNERGDWEIAGVPDSAIQEFSRRTKLIEREANALGYETGERRGGVGARTREDKGRARDLDSLKASWRKRITQAEHAAMERTRSGGPGKPFDATARASQETLSRVIQETAARVFTRMSVVSLNYFVSVALNRGQGMLTEASIREAVQTREFLIRKTRGVERITDQRSLDREAELIALIKSGIGKFAPRGRVMKEGVFRVFEPRMAAVSEFAQARFAAALKSTDQVVLLLAHTEAERSALRNNLLKSSSVEQRALVLAPTTRAKEQMRKELPGVEVVSVKKFLTDSATQARAASGVVVVTHAELVGTADGHKLMEVAVSQKTRVDLLAVREANRSATAGSIVSLAYKYSNLSTDYRLERGKLVHDVDGNVTRSRADVPLPEPSRAIPVELASDVIKTVAAEYAHRSRWGDSVNAVAAKPEEREALTKEIRAALGGYGRLGASRKRSVLEPASPDADDLKSRRGLIAVPLHTFKHGSVPGMREKYKPGEEWKIRIDGLGKLIATNGARVRELPAKKLESFAFFKPKKLELASGDRIRMLKDTNVHSVFDLTTDHKLKFNRLPRHKLCAGRSYEVKRLLVGGRVLLTNGTIIPKEFKFYTHGYVDAPRQGQAEKADHVLFATTKEHAWSVNAGMVRSAQNAARKSFQILTDAPDIVRKALARPDTPLTATSMAEMPRFELGDKRRELAVRTRPQRERDFDR